jgi:hypothetical protein
MADVLRDYQIVVPVMPYKLVLEEGQIDVSYAIARPWKKDAPWLAVNLRRSKAPQYYQYPDLSWRSPAGCISRRATLQGYPDRACAGTERGSLDRAGFVEALGPPSAEYDTQGRA